MSKPSGDLSALFRSLRPDESVFQESSRSSAQDAEQRWPLFKALSPQKPQDTPALSEQERQRWTSQEKPAASIRKPALSLPGLSDKMSKSLERMSGQAVKSTDVVKLATRRDSEKHVESVVEQVSAKPSKQAPRINTPANRTPTVTKPAAVTSSPVSVPVAPAASPVSARDLPATGDVDESLKNIFNRLQAKPEVEPKPASKRSSFMDRLGKR